MYKVYDTRGVGLVPGPDLAASRRHPKIMPNITIQKAPFLVLGASFFCGLPATAAPTVDPGALALLKSSAATYQHMTSFSCQARAELTLGGVLTGRITKMTMAFQKPDRAAVSVNKYDETAQYFCDGKSFYSYSPANKEYVQDDLPAGVARVAPVLMQGQSFLGLVLLRPAGLSTLADAAGIKSLTLGPLETLDGVAVRTVTRITSGRDGGQMTFFVTIGVRDHLVHRFADIIQSPKPLSADMGGVKRIDNRETYTDIRINPALPASTFLPPPDAKKAEPGKRDQKQTDHSTS